MRLKENESLEPNKLPEYTYSIRKEWDDDSALEVYILLGARDYIGQYSYNKSTGFLGLGETVRVYVSGPPVKHSFELSRGDLEWAQKIAEHYNIKIPEEFGSL